MVAADHPGTYVDACVDVDAGADAYVDVCPPAKMAA